MLPRKESKNTKRIIPRNKLSRNMKGSFVQKRSFGTLSFQSVSHLKNTFFSSWHVKVLLQKLTRSIVFFKKIRQLRELLAPIQLFERSNKMQNVTFLGYKRRQKVIFDIRFSFNICFLANCSIETLTRGKNPSKSKGCKMVCFKIWQVVEHWVLTGFSPKKGKESCFLMKHKNCRIWPYHGMRLLETSSGC